MSKPSTVAKSERRSEAATLFAKLEQRISRIEDILEDAGAFRKNGHEVERASCKLQPARSTPLDQIKEVILVSSDLRTKKGKLSADRVASLFGISLSELARWLGRSKQAVSKTPDADSLQPALGYFERVSRLRLMLGGDAAFRKWLRTASDDWDGLAPLGMLAAGHWQELVDYVEDALTGAPG